MLQRLKLFTELPYKLYNGFFNTIICRLLYHDVLSWMSSVPFHAVYISDSCSSKQVQSTANRKFITNNHQLYEITFELNSLRINKQQGGRGEWHCPSPLPWGMVHLPSESQVHFSIGKSIHQLQVTDILFEQKEKKKRLSVHFAYRFDVYH